MREVIKKFINYFYRKVLYLPFIILLLLFATYIFSNNFRYFLYYLNIDPNFLLAFITVITLLLSIIGNRKEREYNFNLNLHNFTRERVESVVGKLFVLMNNSNIYLKTIKDIKHSMDKNKKFIDANDVLSLTHSQINIESIGAYITMYFGPYIQEDWNLLYDKINKIGSNCSNILGNYNENYNPIGTEHFENEVLSNIDAIINESVILNKEIYDLTEEMKNTLLNIVVANDNKIKQKYIK